MQVRRTTTKINFPSKKKKKKKTLKKKKINIYIYKLRCINLHINIIDTTL